MFCPKCGKEVKPGEVFCGNCGAAIKEGDSENTAPVSKSGKGKKRGTSTAPIVLGLVGGILGLPSALFSGGCAAGLTSDSEIGDFYFGVGIVAALATIVFSCFAKRFPTLTGVILLICVALGMVAHFVTFNLLGIISVILTLIGAILCFTQKKEYL